MGIWGSISGCSATVSQRLGQGHVSVGMDGPTLPPRTHGKHCRSAWLSLLLLGALEGSPWCCSCPPSGWDWLLAIFSLGSFQNVTREDTSFKAVSV